MTRNSRTSRVAALTLAACGLMAAAACSGSSEAATPVTPVTPVIEPAPTVHAIASAPSPSRSTTSTRAAVTADNICSFVSIDSAQSATGVSPLTATAKTFDGKLACKLAAAGAKPDDYGVVMFIYDPTMHVSYDPGAKVGGLPGGTFVVPDPAGASYPETTGRRNYQVSWVHDTHPLVLSARGPSIAGSNGNALVRFADEIEQALTP